MFIKIKRIVVKNSNRSLLNFLKKSLLSLSYLVIPVYTLFSKNFTNYHLLKYSEEYSLKNCNVFFGYYDKDPLNKNKLLAHSIIDNGEDCVIGYFDLESKNFVKVDSTNSWSWQFGSRLQWLNEKDERIIFNRKIGGKSCSIIKSLKTRDVVKINFPIFDYNYKTNFATSINFHHLYKFEQGYGYNNSPETEIGLFIIDIKNNEKKKIVSFNKLINLLNDTTVHINNCHINLPFFNPEGNKIAFLFKWKGKKKTEARLMVWEKNQEIKIINKNGYVAHFNWLGDHKLVYVIKRNNKTEYCIFDIDKNEESILKGLFEDGHPTFYKNKIISDKYPSLIKRRQELFIYDIDNSKADILYSSISRPRHNGVYKCDFHPRVNLESDTICIDEGSDKYRKMILLKLKNKIV